MDSKLKYVSSTYCLCVICVHSVGWGKDYRNEGFGGQSGVKVQLVNLISSVQTLLRGSEFMGQLVMVVMRVLGGLLRVGACNSLVVYCRQWEMFVNNAN